VQMPFRVHADAGAAIFYSDGLRPSTAMGELSLPGGLVPERKSPGAKREGQPGLSAGITWRFSQQRECTPPQPWHQEERSCSQSRRLRGVYCSGSFPEPAKLRLFTTVYVCDTERSLHLAKSCQQTFGHPCCRREPCSKTDRIS
jgi:hypothetical protein